MLDHGETMINPHLMACRKSGVAAGVVPPELVRRLAILLKELHPRKA